MSATTSSGYFEQPSAVLCPTPSEYYQPYPLQPLYNYTPKLSYNTSPTHKDEGNYLQHPTEEHLPNPKHYINSERTTESYHLPEPYYTAESLPEALVYPTDPEPIVYPTEQYSGEGGFTELENREAYSKSPVNSQFAGFPLQSASYINPFDQVMNHPLSYLSRLSVIS